MSFNVPVSIFLPSPRCALGYPLDQVEHILEIWKRGIKEFEVWMDGQTKAICEGMTPFYTACPEPHGTVIYRHDLERFLDRKPVLDW